MSVALIDAGPMIALFDAQDVAHDHYMAKIQQDWSLTTTWPCVVEACYFLEARQKRRYLGWIAGGAVTIYPFDASELTEMAELMDTYTQRPRTQMDLADATLVWLAAETNVTRIMTMDVRDFSRYRLPDGRGFEIL